VDPKDSHVNKFNYIVASQDDNVRAKMREIPGVPLIYIKRSIMILEPMAGASTDRRAREEKSKMKEGITKMGARGTKRSRDDDETGTAASEKMSTAQEEPDRKRKKKGPKGPNPLSMRKPKARDPEGTHQPRAVPKSEEAPRDPVQDGEPEQETAEHATEDGSKKKRRRKHKSKTEAGGGEASIATAGDISDG
jgi:U3 small nucleolar RNA-associated protein 23